MLQKIKATASYLKSNYNITSKIGIVLGSGLGNFAENIKIIHRIPYEKIPNFPVSTVKGHGGELIYGTLNNIPVILQKGRFHYYEGWSMNEVVFPVRVMHFLGVEYYMVTNAAGGTNYNFNVGDIMMITDQINFFGANPLIGKNIDELGPRFPDMSNAYNESLCIKAREIARKNQVPMQEGVYIGGTGPSFETKAEYRLFNMMGADAVGMSTVPEVIAANHMSMKVFGISVITNNGLDIPEEGNHHDDVLDAASKAEANLTTILTNLILEIE